MKVFNLVRVRVSAEHQWVEVNSLINIIQSNDSEITYSAFEIGQYAGTQIFLSQLSDVILVEYDLHKELDAF